MEAKSFFGFFLILFFIFLIGFYFLTPFGITEFSSDSDRNFNFLLNNSLSNPGMQFYENMRYPNSRISYQIYDCPLYKQNRIKEAFSIISNLTILEFYPTISEGDISAFCSERSMGEVRRGATYVAGEGGPINITQTSNFNVILKGEITLIKESDCKIPNVAIHEIFHSIGYKHSENENSIMYPVSNCNQKIGQDILENINEIYAYPTHADLNLKEASAVMNGKFLDTNVSIRNEGLKESEKANLILYADEKIIKEFEIEPIEIGFGSTIILKNILITQLSVDEITYIIESNEEELSKSNNELKLKIKNKN
ncbi:MAG: matrixin family metalloprotease [Candidatus Pacearchaeota archaeon]